MDRLEDTIPRTHASFVATHLRFEDHHAPPLFTWRDRLNEGQLVDAQDAAGRWRESYVVHVERESIGLLLPKFRISRVFVHFTELPKKDDEWLDADSERLQPLFARTTQWRTVFGRSSRLTFPSRPKVHNAIRTRFDCQMTGGAGDRTAALLADGAKVDLFSSDGTTALSAASATRSGVGDVELLLGAGAKPDRPARSGKAALHLAASLGSADTARALVGGGADLELPCGRAGWTPLHYATHRGAADVVAALLELGADPNAVALRGTRPAVPLELAAVAGSLDTCRLLLGAGAHDRQGRAALLAHRHRHAEVAEALGWDPYAEH